MISTRPTFPGGYRHLRVAGGKQYKGLAAGRRLKERERENRVHDRTFSVQRSGESGIEGRGEQEIPNRICRNAAATNRIHFKKKSK